MCPLLPEGGDIGPGGDGGHEVGTAASVASHLGIGRVHDGIIVS